jgi:hypothetical protein
MALVATAISVFGIALERRALRAPFNPNIALRSIALRAH